MGQHKGSIWSFTGTVTTEALTVTWVSGSTFKTGSSWNGQNIVINGATYTIDSIQSENSLTLTATAGTQTPAIPYTYQPVKAITAVPARTAMTDESGALTRTWLDFFQSLGAQGTTGAQGPAGAAGISASAGSGAYLSVDPRAHAAHANGTSDDSIALSFAIAQGGLFLQPGVVYAFTWSGIQAALAAVTDGFQIYGGGTLRLISGTSAALAFSGSAVIKLYDFVLDGNNLTGTYPVILLNGASNIYMRGLLVIGGGSNPNLGTIGTCTYAASGCHGIADQVGLI